MVLKYKAIHAFDKYKTMKIIYSMYRAGEVSIHRACCERATQPYSLGGEGTIYPGSRPAGVTTHCLRMATECLLTLRLGSFMRVIFHSTSTAVADPEGVRGVQTNPLLRPKLFHFYGNFRKKWSNCTNRTPSANLNPRSKNPGSAPVQLQVKCIAMIGIVAL